MIGPKTRFWRVVLGALAMVLLGASLAAANVRVVEAVPPAFRVGPDERESALKAGDVLAAGETVTTGDGGRVVLELANGSRLELSEDGRMDVNEVLGDEGDEQSSFSLLVGYVRCRLNKLVAPEIVVTPTVVAGVRGTDFAVNVAEDGASVVSVAEGEVEVAAGDEDEKPAVAVLPDQEVEAQEEGAPLRTRERRMKSPEDGRKIRAERLARLLPKLPEIMAKQEKALGPELDRLDQLADAIEKKAAQAKTLAERLQALGAGAKAGAGSPAGASGSAAGGNKPRWKPGSRQPASGAPVDAGPGGAGQGKALFVELYKETGQLLKLAKTFHRRYARLGSGLSRAKRLARMMPKLQSQLGDQYAGVQASFERLGARVPEIKSRLTASGTKVKKAMASVQPILKKMQELKARNARTGAGAGTGPVKKP